MVGESFPDYDTTFSLIWGRDIASGEAPDYSIPFRPAAHPLIVALAAALSPLGESGAATAVHWLVLLGAGALVAGVFRLGQTLFGTAVGAAAALILFTRTPVWSYSELAYVDVPAAAMVVWAALMVARWLARPPPRGHPPGARVLVLLALAGLLRPEVWLIAAAYALFVAWHAPRRIPAAFALAALAPAVWVAWDLITTGGFLSSVRSENAPPAPSSGGKGLGAAPEALARDIGGFLRAPEAILGLAGVVAGLVWLRTRSLVPVAVGLLNGLAFVLVAAGGGPLEQRYLIPAAAMLVLFAAVALLGWRVAPAGPVARAWRLAAVPGALALLVYAPVDVDRLRDLRAQVRAAHGSYEELRSAVRRCSLPSRVHVPDVRLRPFVAYWADVPADRVGTEPGGASIEPLDPVARELTSRSLPTTLRDNGDAPSWSVTGCERQ